MSPRRRRRRPVPTPAEIWRILRQVSEEQRQMAAERRQEALDAAERERAHQEALRASEAAWREELRRQREERERYEAERDHQWERELARLYGDGDNRWGKLVEALVESNLKKVLREAGMDVEHVLTRRRSQIDGIWREYDLVAVGLSEAVVVEVKTTLRSADVTKFLNRIGNFRLWRPDDARPTIFGAFAYLTAEGEAESDAEAAGLYRIQAVTGSARMVNSEGFEPRLF